MELPNWGIKLIRRLEEKGFEAYAVGGCVRDMLLGKKPEDYDFYLDLRKYGSTRHSGFGLGFERMVMYATGIANIRDVIPYPRTVGKCQY